MTSSILQATEATLQSKEQDLLTAQEELHKAQQELGDKDRQLGNLAADLNGGEPGTQSSDFAKAWSIILYVACTC